ncbi:hypothetical protein PMAYCL1PPCAC_16390, partial [Pristionchus mayeri]
AADLPSLVPSLNRPRLCMARDQRGNRGRPLVRLHELCSARTNVRLLCTQRCKNSLATRLQHDDHESSNSLDVYWTHHRHYCFMLQTTGKGYSTIQHESPFLFRNLRFLRVSLLEFLQEILSEGEKEGQERRIAFVYEFKHENWYRFMCTFYAQFCIYGRRIVMNVLIILQFGFPYFSKLANRQFVL